MKECGCRSSNAHGILQEEGRQPLIVSGTLNIIGLIIFVFQSLNP